MKRAYAPLIDGQQIIPPLYPNLGFRSSGNMLHFDKVFAACTEPVVELVDRAEDADILLIPHPFAAARKHEAYMTRMTETAVRLGKKLVLVLYGDSDEIINLPNAVVLRTSQYSYRKQNNEIMMPAYAEDLLAGRTFTPRAKGDRPTIGFCGWSKPRDLKNLVGTFVKNAVTEAKALVNSDRRSELKGITLRSRALSSLRGTDGIICNFIERSSYSGHKNTISLDPQRARQEFVANMEGSDFVLCVKGDGNFSYRFYETLSMGRIPLLLDTHCCLPLEDRIDYSAFVCRVPLSDLRNIGTRVREWYGAHSPQEFAARQQSARDAFAEALSTPKFFAIAFRELL